MRGLLRLNLHMKNDIKLGRSLSYKNRKKMLWTGGLITCFLALTFIWIGKYPKEKYTNRFLASTSDIICQNDSGYIDNQYYRNGFTNKNFVNKDDIVHGVYSNRKEIKILCYWMGKDSNERILYKIYLEDEASQTFLLKIDSENIIKEVVPETDTFIFRDKDSKEIFLGKHDVINGKELAIKITTDSKWPDNEKWQHYYDYEIDKERKLLSLKTHDGLDFYSYYYEPTGERKTCEDSKSPKTKKEVVVLIPGGSSSYTDRPMMDNSMGIQTASFLRDMGYVTLMANVRGKERISNDFRLSGIGKMYSYVVQDIITALDELSNRIDIDKSDIKVIGCSRGGHMASLFATNLINLTTEYKVTKTISSSGVLDTTLGSLNYYKKLPKKFPDMSMEDINRYFLIDFTDYDWMNGALCPERPKGIYTDAEWKKILKFDKFNASKYLRRYPNLNQTLCKNSVYKNNSPSYHIANLQGEFLGMAGYNETGNTSVYAPLHFKSLDTEKKIMAIIHPFGHCLPPASFSYSKKIYPYDILRWNFKKRIFGDFLNGCYEEVSMEKIERVKEKIKNAYSCIEKNFKEATDYYLSIEKLEEILTRYEKDFLICRGKNTSQCRWQTYMNYAVLWDMYKGGKRGAYDNQKITKTCIED